MDKETVSHYGWIVVVLILALTILTMSAPLSDYVFINIKMNTINTIEESRQNKQDTVNVPLETVEHNINYNLNGGAWNGGYITKYVEGKATALPTNLSKQYYDFAGWSLTNSNNGQTVEITSYTNTDLTLYAKWIGKNYTISYNLNGGTFTSSPTLLNYRYGSTITLPTNVIKEGYEFIGWYDETLDVPISTSSTTRGNLTVFAKWRKID